MQRRIVLLALLLASVGCGGGSSNSSTAAGPLTGNWQITLQNADKALKAKTQSGFLLQQNNQVSGDMTLRAPLCAGVGGVTGQVSGSSVNLTIVPTGLSINLMGTIGSDQASMNGNYTILTEGCSAVGVAPESGTWTANLLPPLNGNFQGTFESNHIGDVTVSGQIAQQPNPSANTSAPLTGNLAVSDYCFSSATLYGAVSGTNVVLNILDADGSQIGQVIGTSSLDSKSVTGTFRVLQQKGKPPCGSGDAGTVTLTF